MQSGVYGILRNRIYIGEVVWNRSKSRKKVRSGARGFVPRPREDWFVAKDETLRIVSDELWSQVHARIAQRSREVGESIKKGLSKYQAVAVGKGRAPKYLLSTLLVCDQCGSRFVIAGAKGASYACSTWLNAGESACKNRVRAPRLDVEDQVLEYVEHGLLTDEALTEYETALKASVRDRQKHLDQGRQARDRRRNELSGEVRRLVDAIATGTLQATGAIGARLKTAEDELALLESIKSEPVDAPVTAFCDRMARYRRMVKNLRQVAGTRIGEVRDALRDLLGTIPVGLDAAGRPVAKVGLQVSVGSGGRI